MRFTVISSVSHRGSGPFTSPAFFGDCSARNATNSRQRGASPKRAYRVEYRCAARPHTKVLRGCLGAVSGDQAELPGPCDGLGAVGGPELAQDVCHVLLTVSSATTSS